MLLNQKYKILYIANPKTATTAVQRWMLSENSSFEKTLHIINGEKLILKEHLTAFEAKKILGEDYYNQLYVIGFIREPISKMVSAYFFYKQGGKNKKLWDKNTKRISSRILQLFKYLSAKILPLNLWILLYPFKDNLSYFTDTKGNLIVRNIGRFEFLKEDLSNILKGTEVSFNLNNLKVVNKSNKSNNYFISPLMLKLLKIRHSKLQKDIQLYHNVGLRFKCDENSN